MLYACVDDGVREQGDELVGLAVFLAASYLEKSLDDIARPLRARGHAPSSMVLSLQGRAGCAERSSARDRFGDRALHPIAQNRRCAHVHCFELT